MLDVGDNIEKDIFLSMVLIFNNVGNNQKNFLELLDLKW